MPNFPRAPPPASEVFLWLLWPFREAEMRCTILGLHAMGIHLQALEGFSGRTLDVQASRMVKRSFRQTSGIPKSGLAPLSWLFFPWYLLDDIMFVLWRLWNPMCKAYTSSRLKMEAPVGTSPSTKT